MNLITANNWTKLYEELGKAKGQALSEEASEKGYAQAWDLISQYKERLILQNEEHKREINEGFNEAWQMLEDAKAQNSDLEGELQREYEEKLEDSKKFYIKKLDQFLPTQR